MQDSTNKWDGLLEEGTPRTGPQPHTEQSPPRPRREYNWSRIFLTVATIILVVTLLWWWTNRDSPSTAKPVAAPSPTRTQLLVEPWSYDTEVSVEANDGAKATIYQVATALLANRHDAAGEVGVDIYNLIKYTRSNQNTNINQRPIVKKGDRISKGDVVADGVQVPEGVPGAAHRAEPGEQHLHGAPGPRGRWPAVGGWARQSRADRTRRRARRTASIWPAQRQ